MWCSSASDLESWIDEALDVAWAACFQASTMLSSGLLAGGPSEWVLLYSGELRWIARRWWQDMGQVGWLSPILVSDFLVDSLLRCGSVPSLLSVSYHCFSSALLACSSSPYPHSLQHSFLSFSEECGIFLYHDSDEVLPILSVFSFLLTALNQVTQQLRVWCHILCILVDRKESIVVDVEIFCCACVIDVMVPGRRGGFGLWEKVESSVLANSG